MDFVISLPTLAVGLVGFVVGLASFIAALRSLGRPVRKGLGEVTELREALVGEPGDARLGRPDRPGLFVIVGQIQRELGELRGVVGRVVHEVETNDGGSMKDEQRRQGAVLADVVRKMATLQASADDAARRVAALAELDGRVNA